MAHRLDRIDTGWSTEVERHLVLHLEQLRIGEYDCAYRRSGRRVFHTHGKPDSCADDQGMFFLQLFGGLVRAHTRSDEVWETSIQPHVDCHTHSMPASSPTTRICP